MALPHSMNRKPLHRRWAVWLMLCVMGLGAALPTVSRAAAWASAGAWVEICSANGAAQWVRGAADMSVEAPADAPVALSLDHCPFCLQPSDRAAPPPAALPFAAEPARSVAIAVLPAAHLLHTLSRPPPARGPPDLT